MSLRIITRFATVVFVALFSPSSHAEDQESIYEINRIQALLTVLNSELKADLDQILTLQEAIKVNARAPLEAQGRSPDAVSYEDVAAAQRRAIQREAVINARLDAILSRSATLDATKQMLLDRIRELGQTPALNTAPLRR
jgi:hypothetical protein